ncbi:MAG: tetraacyldisaccharide 4'-kinase [Gammaproteobacteria bacterium]
MERAITRLWYHGGFAATLLQPLAWLYGAVIGARRSFYRHGWLTANRVARPVVVVGNLTVGGTGKTPLVAWLAQRLAERGIKVGILSRGYGSTASSPRIVELTSHWRDVGDEPLLLRRRTGCLTVVSIDRVAGAKALIECGVDVILADDGLQHLRLARDCEVIVVDGARGFGNGRLLPAGPLREPASELARADLIVINGPPDHASIAHAGPHSACLATAGPDSKGRTVQMSLAAGEVTPLAGGAAPRPLSTFQGQRVHAVAGIGNPPRFFTDLRSHGIEVVEHPFPDHHPFSAADLEFGDGAPILMTEKDAVKCRLFASERAWYVPVTARFSEPQATVALERVIQKLGLSVSARG